VRWFVTGGDGQLGSALQRLFAGRDEVCFARDLDLDVADALAVDEALAALPGGPPDVLVNAAAMTQVDTCEREPAQAERVNALAPRELARVCAQRGVRLVHVSTDYVFAGDGTRPYREDDACEPPSVYGRTKRAGEEAVLGAAREFLVVRTSWLYGRGRNFLAAILAQAAAGKPLRVVDDQRGRPTYAADLAEGLVALTGVASGGLYHLANRGEASWCELARAALAACGRGDVPVAAIPTDVWRREQEARLEQERGPGEAAKRIAPRPRYSVLDCEKAAALGVVLRLWPEALAAYLASDDAPLAARGA
jgi:dTDP-4-dehydrorhamnose reductase